MSMTTATLARFLLFYCLPVYMYGCKFQQESVTDKSAVAVLFSYYLIRLKRKIFVSTAEAALRCQIELIGWVGGWMEWWVGDWVTGH